MLDVRPAAVAGVFYPADRDELARTVDDLLHGAPHTSTRVPRALIVPHAAYQYSGPIAAAAFASVRTPPERIVLVGPAHRRYVRGLAAPGAARLATPLGTVDVDTAALAAIDHADDPTAHAREHCLEVMLPFVQRIAPRAKIVPLLASEAAPDVVGRVLEALWGGPETLVIVSSDLSHYLPYDAARRKDAETAQQILAREPIDDDRACGAVAINGLSWLARRAELSVEMLDLRSSGDTAGERERVVGYGAFAYYPRS